MSIASEITRLQTAKSDLKTSIENKGVTVPSATTIDGYAALVDQISGGIVYTNATIIVKVDTRSTVNLYSDSGFTTLVQSGEEVATGIYWFTNLSIGTYYVKATKDSYIATETVVVSALVAYYVVLYLRVVPTFQYTGSYEILDASNNLLDETSLIAMQTQNWKIRFLTSGTLTVSTLGNATGGIDLFLVGGGGGGGCGGGTNNQVRGGGGGGYTKSVATVPISEGVDYPIVVGAGGAKTSSTSSRGGDGGASSAFGSSVKGGYGGISSSATKGNGSNGGSGGGLSPNKSGGTNGGNGVNASSTNGLGQGTSTREFYSIDHNASARLYSTGGHSNNTTAGGANTGNGGGGYASTGSSAVGGSGVVVIRKARAS